MNSPAPALPWLTETTAALRKHYLLWAVPTIAMTVLSGGYALVRPVYWKATQALVVRDEAVGSVTRQGRFDSTDAMKTAQETILEISKNQSVVTAALVEIGPPGGASAPRWPAPDDIRRLQKAISVSAPKGAEFGRTEVIYLSVLGQSRAEAARFSEAVCRQLELRLSQLRDDRAQSIIAELEKRRHLAEADRAEATVRLQAFESNVGSDLGELRNLNESGTGDSNLRLALNQIDAELRAARSSQQTYQEQRQLLEVAQNDAGELVATPNRLLESQPALRRLKDGLVDAQLQTSALLGKMSPDHPLVKAAQAAEQEVRSDLYAELELALKGLAADFQVNAALITTLEKQAGEVRHRLDRLAQLRAGYSNLVAESRQRTEVLEKADKELADARASRSAAHTSSLITRLDAPDTGSGPVGPGGLTIVAAGVAGGLATGLGLVLLLAPPQQVRGRRWSDYLGFGRRAGDRGAASSSRAPPGRRADETSSSRRAEDSPRTPPATPAAGPGDRRAGQDRRAVPPAAANLEVAAPLDAVLANPASESATPSRVVEAEPVAASVLEPARPAREPSAAKDGKRASLGQALRWVAELNERSPG